jgi:hypothetical protein
MFQVQTVATLSSSQKKPDVTQPSLRTPSWFSIVAALQTVLELVFPASADLIVDKAGTW